MTCDECGATIRKKEGYLHCFTCEPTRIACYTCMRQFHGAGSPPDVQGDPCPELCHFCQDQQCHLSVGHEGKHACGNVQKCLRKTRKWYPEQVGTENEQLQALEDVVPRSRRTQSSAASEAPSPSSQKHGTAVQALPNQEGMSSSWSGLPRLPTPLVERNARMCATNVSGHLQRVVGGTSIAWVFLIRLEALWAV